MNYFKILGIIFGLIALLKPFYKHILPWDEFKVLRKAYSKNRHQWAVWVSVFGIKSITNPKKSNKLIFIDLIIGILGLVSLILSLEFL